MDLNTDFLTLITTMVGGGIVYSIMSFAYMHRVFPRAKDVEEQRRRILELERTFHSEVKDVYKELKDINEKLNRLIGAIK